MRIVIPGPFASRKVALDWPQAGMTKKNHARWLEALTEQSKAVQEPAAAMMKEGKHLRIKVVIAGESNKIKPLDIHDALAQVVDELTEAMFPRPKGRPIPQTQDRHYWQCEAEKLISNDPRVEIEIEEFVDPQRS